MKKGKKNIAFLICLAVLIIAVAVGIVYKVQQARREADYKKLAQQVTAEPSVTEGEPEPEPVEGVQIPIDFEKLTEENPDVYAWIQIADTQVDYPVLQSPANVDYYLDHTFEGKEGLPGALYTQYNYNPNGFEDPITVIYGHNMRDDSFFGGLSEYLNEEFRNSHSEISIYTPEHIYHYKVVFAVTYDDRHILANYDCAQPEQYDAFLTSIQTERLMPSWVEDPFSVTSADKMILLSTCNGNSSTRFLVGAVLTERE